MINFFKQNFIFLIVFLTGAAVLIIEITATRILSPYFGNTIFTVSSVLGVILGALSLGYYFGGWLSDKYPRYDIFFLLIFFGGLSSSLIYFLSRTLLFTLSFRLDLIFGPLITSLLLFFLPSLFLGTLSPFAIKLTAFKLEKIGTTSGKVYFWSTLGSILGSFFAGFYLIPHFGTSKIVIFTGLFLSILGMIGFLLSKKTKNRFFLVVLFFLVNIFNFFGFLIDKSQFFIFQKDGFYSPIFIHDSEINNKKVRILRFDFIISQAGVFLDSEELPFEYTKYYRLYKIQNPEAKKALFIGGGAYSTPRRLLLDESNFESIDVVEIEPELYQIAKKYFRLIDDHRLKNHILDGRRFLLNTKEFYDLIFLDAYSFGIPDHFATKEFFSLAKSRLSENGIFLMNVVGSLKEGMNSLVLSVTKTFCSVFKNCYLIAVNSPQKMEIQNFILLATRDEKKQLNFSEEKILKNEDEIIRELPEKIVNLSNFNFEHFPILTDDFAPVEYLTSEMIKFKQL